MKFREKNRVRESSNKQLVFCKKRQQVDVCFSYSLSFSVISKVLRISLLFEGCYQTVVKKVF